MKPQLAICIVLTILGFLFYGPYLYIMVEKQMNDFFSIIGVVLLLTLILGTCLIILGTNYKKVSKQSEH